MNPFFSILIPTKNRRDILAKSIESVLIQTFKDFEILIIDNSDESLLAKDLISTYKDPRLKYFRTGDLSMPDNWEFAFQKANGRYITILTDRLRYINRLSLKRIFDVLNETKSDIISWEWITNNIQYNDEFKREFFKVDSSTLIQNFLTSDIEIMKKVGPRGLNSALKKTLYDKIVRVYGRICPPISPDYTLAFLQLHFAHSFIHMRDKIFVEEATDVSNGRKATSDQNYLEDIIISWGLKVSDILKYTPSKVLTVNNSIYNDFFSIYSSRKLHTKEIYELNRDYYHKLIRKDISRFEKQNQKKNLKILRKEIDSYLVTRYGRSQWMLIRIKEFSKKSRRYVKRLF